MSDTRPGLCRNRLRDEGKPHPRSGCAVCRNGGMMGCPHERNFAAGPILGHSMSEIEITQADRDRANEYLSSAFRCTETLAERFARHRHEARAEALEEFLNFPKTAVHSDGPGAYENGYNHAVSVVRGKASRALRSGEREG